MEMDQVKEKLEMEQDVSGIAQDKEGKTHVSCQLCEIDKIKCKCIACDYLMCERCCKVHKKIKSSNEHTIIDFKDIGLYQGQSENVSHFKNINCRVHNGQNYCLFCTNCDLPVCLLCIEESHNDHPFKDINKGYEISVDKLKALSSDIDDDIGKLTAGMNLKVEVVGKVSKDKEKDKIRSQGESLHDAVNLLTNKRLDELDQRWDKQSKSIQDGMKCSKKRKEDLETRNQYLMEVVQSGDPSTVFRVIQEENEINRQRIKSVNTKCSTVVEFIPGEINLSVIEQLYGRLEDNDIYAPTEIRFYAIKQYTTKLSTISNLKCDKESVWIYDRKNKDLLNVTNGSLKTIRTLNIDAHNMALLPTGDILLSSRNTLLILSHTTWKAEYFKCKQSLENINEALHVTKDNKIIVGRVNISWQRELLVMDITGNHETVYCHDINKLFPCSWIQNESMFNNPIRVTSDSCHNVYVIDGHAHHRVVVLGQAGEVRGIYSGCGNSLFFRAVDLVATELDNVIVLDAFSGLHVINSKGKCIKCQMFSDLGMKPGIGESAQSLDIDNNGMLLIGCESLHNDAKLYVIKFSGI